MDMGYADTGGGPPASGHGAHGTRSVTSLITDPARPADVQITVTARRQEFTLKSGRRIDGYTLNGLSPGPTIHATEGQLVEVRLVNESVKEGVSLHWHGVDVPNAEDGVAGVTQDAVAMGHEHTYRFVPHQTGTYWYHSHQNSHVQVPGGLFGALVIMPKQPLPASVADTLAVVHIYHGFRTINGLEGDVPVAAKPGQRVRVRVVNTENGEMVAWAAGAPMRLMSIDGSDIRDPAPFTGTVQVAAGGSGVRVQLGGAQSMLLGDAGRSPAPIEEPRDTVDLLSYGVHGPAGFEPGKPDRVFTYDIGRRPGFINGRPGLFWTVNGHLLPDLPMFVVAEGDVVQMTISNHSGQAHPMHLHGHHAVVLSRNGVEATGSPWRIDSLTVGNGETYVIAFVADNPGMWMDHCHNLPHVGQGLVAHLMYEGVTTPFVIGGAAGNNPE
jgi:FtsP/CotA-like multicopper oxidase with cupredoxin domain